MRTFIHRNVIVAALAFACVVGHSAWADVSMKQQTTLAMRFRPYVKTTLDGSNDEPFHPVSWKWFVENTQVWIDPASEWAPLGYGAQKMNPAVILTLPDASIGMHALLHPHIALPDPGYQLLFYDLSLEHGEDWSDVINLGDGFFAHVEAIPNRNQFNIEYTITWAHNAADFSNHDGDLTTVTAVYDADADLLVRITYSIHGCALESYRVAAPTSFLFETAYGLDASMSPTSVPVATLLFDDNTNIDIQHSGDCSFAWSDSDGYVSLAQDPQTQLYEHIVIYAEDGSHEPWPNPTGQIGTVPSHSGDGVSFLPATLSVLGTVAQHNPDYDTFLMWNGKWGSDPQSIMLHKSWYWPNDRKNNPYAIPDSRFKDKDPYDPTSKLGWPPQPENTSGAVVLYVAPVQPDGHSTSFIDNTLLPFPGLLAALSFVPKNGVLALNPGNYPVQTTITRPMQLVAHGGPAILGK